mmetsp:Transcript_1740/g.3205  ORF Transcript_1740/g.3205 Transcript_1740/m.3205 type:complete len:130 (-) Transcript_1740:133-522(-)
MATSFVVFVSLAIALLLRPSLVDGQTYYKNVCKGNYVELYCPRWRGSIQIRRAIYGRTTINPACGVPLSVRQFFVRNPCRVNLGYKFSIRCDGRQRCKIYVGGGITANDPCPRRAGSTLNLAWGCIPSV